MFQQLLTTQDVKIESVTRRGGNSLKTTVVLRGCRATFERVGRAIEVTACWPAEMTISVYQLLEKKAEEVLLNKCF